MKKQILHILIFLLIGSAVSAQEEINNATQSHRSSRGNHMLADAEVFQATIKNGNNPNQFLIYLKPNTLIPVGTVFADGTPAVSFSILGTTATSFTSTYHLNLVTSVVQQFAYIGGRTKSIVIANASNAPVLPWPADEERLAFTINVVGDDTVGARLEFDMNLGVYIFYVYDETSLSDFTNYTDPFYVTPGGQSREGIDGTFRYVTVPGLGVLPVNFSSFKATCGDKGVSINWTTSSEQNASHFEIEKSTDGSSWTKIDQVAAAGNSSTDRNYQYLDLAGGAAQYRIRQVDFDGQASYSAIRSVDCESKDVSVQVYPIPARDNLNIAVRSDKSIRTEFKVFDMGGKMVKSQPVVLNSGNSNVAMNVSNLPSGEYVIRSTDGMLQLNKKFTIAR